MKSKPIINYKYYKNWNLKKLKDFKPKPLGNTKISDVFSKNVVFDSYQFEIQNSNPLSVENLFRIYLKSLNKNYTIPPVLEKYLPNTLKLINQLSYINYKVDYYYPIYNLLSSKIVGNFDYLFKSGLIFFLISKSKDSKELREELMKSMQQNNDPLLSEITFFLNNNTYLNSNIFGYLANIFINNSSSYINDIPSNVFKMLLQANTIYNLLNQKNFVDLYLTSKIKDFLSNFSISFNINLENYFKNLSFKDVEIWKQIFLYLSQILNTLNSVKSYPINDQQELDKFLDSLYYLNLTLKDNSLLSVTQKKLISKEHSEILKNLINEYQLNGLSYSDAVKNSVQNFSSSYSAYINSFIRKTLRAKDFSYGDFNHFLKIYSYSSFLIELIQNSKENTPEFSSYKTELINILRSKKLANNFVNFIILNPVDNSSKQKILTALEILKSLSQRAVSTATFVDPSISKDRTLFLRINLLFKILKQLPKDSNYPQNITFLLGKLKEIISSYPNSQPLLKIIQNINTQNIDLWIKILEPVFNQLPLTFTKKYENIDYLFSQTVIYTFWKNKNSKTYYDDNLREMFLNNLYLNDKDLKVLVDDLGSYNSLKIEERDLIFSSLVETLGNYYNSCTFLL